MNPKLKEELIDLAHLIHQAIITDDDRVAEAALADLRAALVHPVGDDHRASRSKFELLRADKMATMVMRCAPKPVVAHIQKFATYCTAEIYRDGDSGPLVDVTVYGGFGRAQCVAKGTMRGLMSSLGHRHRLLRNRHARENSATQVNG